MEKLISNFSIDENFWESNPNIKHVKEFKELYNGDRSKRKEDSSKTMWAIAMLMDKNQDNPYRNLTEEDRKVIIAEDFIGNKKFDWSSIKDLVDSYRIYCLTPIERSLVQIEKKIHERDKLISETQYTINTADDLDKLILTTKKIKDFYNELKTELEQEQSSDGITKGGRIESLGELKQI